MPPKKTQSSTVDHHHSSATPGISRKVINRGGSSCHWTNERHVHFLNSIEASFVESMFGGGNGAATATAPPLDRYLPDTAESTQDLAKERRTKASPSGSSGRRTNKNTRIHSCQKCSQDQVVPQFHKRDDEDEDDDVPFGTAH